MMDALSVTKNQKHYTTLFSFALTQISVGNESEIIISQ